MTFPSSLPLGAAVAALGLLLASTPTAQAQSYGSAAPKRHYTAEGKAYFRGPTRLTIGLGTGYYNGDLTNRIGDQFFGPALNVGFLRRYSPHFAFGGELGYVRVGAKDYLPARGLAFNTNAYAATVLVRWYLLADRTALAGGGGNKASRLLPFVQGGAGVVLYSAESYLGKTRTPLPTAIFKPEVGSYPALTSTLPVGAGLTYRCTDDLSLSLEGNYYFLFTDTFDDTSKRTYTGAGDIKYFYANPGANDAFGTLMLKAEIKL